LGARFQIISLEAAAVNVYISPSLSLYSPTVAIETMHPIMMCLLTFYAYFSICLQHKIGRLSLLLRRDKMHHLLAVHFVLQTNQKSVQKKLTSKFKFHASFQ